MMKEASQTKFNDSPLLATIRSESEAAGVSKGALNKIAASTLRTETNFSFGSFETHMNDYSNKLEKMDKKEFIKTGGEWVEIVTAANFLIPQHPELKDKIPQINRRIAEIGEKLGV